jgi:nitroimidazol reductase NimA-like FMN-containing flavoprotein (pyridoxamine 5'-phosphate oxidase superfamily)
MAPEPRRDRPAVPDYGIPDTDEGLLPWSWAERILAESLVYWLSTVRPDGRPHAVPTWAAWLDGRLWFEGGRGTRHARNLREHPDAVASIHVDDATALIVEGRVELTSDPRPDLASRLVTAYAKYRASPWAYEADPSNWSSARGGMLAVLRPTKVLGWTHFPDDATRWCFDDADRSTG